jgi:hypothetical protein
MPHDGGMGCVALTLAASLAALPMPVIYINTYTMYIQTCTTTNMVNKK